MNPADRKCMLHVDVGLRNGIPTLVFTETDGCAEDACAIIADHVVRWRARHGKDVRHPLAVLVPDTETRVVVNTRATVNELHSRYGVDVELQGEAR